MVLGDPTDDRPTSSSGRAEVYPAVAGLVRRPRPETVRCHVTKYSLGPRLGASLD